MSIWTVCPPVSLWHRPPLWLGYPACLSVSLPFPCGTGFVCHGTDPGIHAVYDKGCNVGGLVLCYSSTEARSPLRVDGLSSEPSQWSRLLMLNWVNTNPAPGPSFSYSSIFPQMSLFPCSAHIYACHDFLKDKLCNIVYCLLTNTNPPPRRPAEGAVNTGEIATNWGLVDLPYTQEVLGSSPSGTTYLMAPPVAVCVGCNTRRIRDFNFFNFSCFVSLYILYCFSLLKLS